MNLKTLAPYLGTTLAAAGILTITMGARQSLGLYVNPISDSTGLGIAAISLALAIGQFTWGLAQPFAGIAAEKYGPARVLVAGILILALGSALAPLLGGAAGLVVSLGLLSAVGSGIGSFSVLLGAAAQRMPAEARAQASGVINAGGSFGQFLFAPIVQKLIQVLGWMGAFWAMAAMTLAALPLVRRLTKAPVTTPPPAANEGSAWRAIGDAMRDRSYLLLHLGFFTCGFHIAFLVTHLPGEVELCGLPASVASWSLAIIGAANIVGSLCAGAWVGRRRSKMILAWMYFSRAALIAAYLLAPRTEWTFYVFAAGLGFTWLATVPPTAAIVGKLFGVRWLATLFGMTLLSHQAGGFLGAWLGGLAFASTGDYTWMWYADIALALMAAVVNLPIREARITAPTPHPA